MQKEENLHYSLSKRNVQKDFSSHSKVQTVIFFSTTEKKLMTMERLSREIIAIAFSGWHQATASKKDQNRGNKRINKFHVIRLLWDTLLLLSHDPESMTQIHAQGSRFDLVGFCVRKIKSLECLSATQMAMARDMNRDVCASLSAVHTMQFDIFCFQSVIY